MTERVGLIGWPVGHSVSPAMHNAAFAALGLDWDYTALAIPPSRFEAELGRLIDEEGYRGFNITVPHKQAAFRLRRPCRIAPEAESVGAVNTFITAADGTLLAENTDWAGFARDLADHGIGVRGLTCLILGTGGSAQAVIYALEQGGAASVTSVSRDPRRRRDVIGYEELAAVAPGADLIVNCTPLGMTPHIEQSPWPDDMPFPPDAVLYDLVYNPPITRLMEQAQAAGARSIGGLGMLVWQGALAFELWTGLMPSVDVMVEAAHAALEPG